MSGTSLKHVLRSSILLNLLFFNYICLPKWLRLFPQGLPTPVTLGTVPGPRDLVAVRGRLIESMQFFASTDAFIRKLTKGVIKCWEKDDGYV